MSETTNEEGFFDRALDNLRSAWRDIAGSAARTVGLSVSDSGTAETKALRKLMRDCLEARGGEVSARARAAQLGRSYLELDQQGKRRFLTILAREFSVSSDKVEAAIERYRRSSDEEERQEAERHLRQELEPPRVKLLMQFNALPTGVKFLVDMRADLLGFLGDDPYLSSLDADLKELLTSWFDVGFLDLKSIDWDSPASLLEKLIAYEAVHEIESWSDLRNRLDSDRRCYALFHPRMPDEPLAFVEVALTDKMSASIQDLLDLEAPEGDPQKAETAIFYSITNTQRGLRGISFGDYLIKRVVAQLNQELPQIKTFATLSPIPGFRSWLDNVDSATVAGLLESDETKALKRLVGRDTAPAVALRSVVARTDWIRSAETVETLKQPLLRLCALYLVSRRSDGRPLDPVARFHLRNGARLERINWLGDTSEAGLRRAAGMMVNYRYVVGQLEENHEAYVRDGRIAFSSNVRSLLKGQKDSSGQSVVRKARGSSANNGSGSAGEA
ncbi:MAG: malonyl-CoA decarboxylase [Rhodovibrionaceae bacterium]|nr:malonyl-CoA decarboxylase [Rhodovibrionaceae bacterium]